MKVARTYTIDHEIVERMQNINASNLINGLLKEYFELRSDKNTLKDEKKAVLSSILKKKSNFLKKLRLLMNGIPLILTIFLKHGFGQGMEVCRDMKSILTSKEEDLNNLEKTLKMQQDFSKSMEKF